MVFPDFDPVALYVGPLAIRWYGLMYLIGFATAWWLGRYRARRADAVISPQQMDDLLFYAALGIILGGRIGIDYRQTQPAPTLTGVTLIDQTETAILCESRQALCAVGLSIRTKTAGPVIVTRQPGGPHHGQQQSREPEPRLPESLP